MRGWACALLAFGLAVCPATIGRAAPANPQLLVLVSAAPNGLDHVAISYAGAVSRDKARRHLDGLLKLTGWQARGIVVDVAPAAAGQPAMTSVSFQAPTVVPYPGGMLPVAPFVQAYKEYASLVVIFRIERPYQFGGPTAYQDAHVAIGLQQSPGQYRYDVRVMRRDFAQLTLPRAASAVGEQETPRAARTSPPALLVLALVVAASFGAGAAVYFYMVSRSSGAHGRVHGIR